jgi:hypothetical protein
MSTGIKSDTPVPEAKLGPKMPPERAQVPIAKTRLGVGMAA